MGVLQTLGLCRNTRRPRAHLRHDQSQLPPRMVKRGWRILAYKSGPSIVDFAADRANGPYSLGWARRPATRLTAGLTAGNHKVRGPRGRDTSRKAKSSRFPLRASHEDRGIDLVGARGLEPPTSRM